MEKSYGDIKANDTKCNDRVKNYSKLDLDTINRGITQVRRALFNTSPESHNLLLYSDIRVLRAMYPAYIKSLLESNEIVLIMTHYDHPSMVRQILEFGSKKNGYADIEKYMKEGSLVIVDSLKTYFNSVHSNHPSNGDEANNSKSNFLTLIRILLNHAIKNDKKGITIFFDMGSFFHCDNIGHHHNQHNNDGNGVIHSVMEYERSIPTRYKDLELKKFCMYHQKDYELYFASKRQKAQLLDCHGRSILIMDGNNNGHSQQ